MGAFRWQGTWDNPSFRKEGQGILVCLVGLATSSWIISKGAKPQPYSCERSLSINAKVVTSDRPFLSNETIVGLML